MPDPCAARSVPCPIRASPVPCHARSVRPPPVQCRARSVRRPFSAMPFRAATRSTDAVPYRRRVVPSPHLCRPHIFPNLCRPSFSPISCRPHICAVPICAHFFVPSPHLPFAISPPPIDRQASTPSLSLLVTIAPAAPTPPTRTARPQLKAQHHQAAPALYQPLNSSAPPHLAKFLPLPFVRHRKRTSGATRPGNNCTPASTGPQQPTLRKHVATFLKKTGRPTIHHRTPFEMKKDHTSASRATANSKKSENTKEKKGPTNGDVAKKIVRRTTVIKVTTVIKNF
ncbi:hypothetical protein niasHT_010675 [Heterodera trifolii]|uniref:Uncharacterized protein n=1 Tax=Heterodera trifolii TaxID=157864 RepID=A0ABD2LEK0_9BILA